jgi:hypothetical protein
MEVSLSRHLFSQKISCSGFRGVSNTSKAVVLLMVSALIVITTGCGIAPVAAGSSAVGTSGVRIAIRPNTASLSPNGTQAFSVTVFGTANSAVLWTASSGLISENGLFTAPAIAATVVITATSVADPKARARATATISVPESSACGPPLYPCSNSGTTFIPAGHPPELGSNPAFFGGHSGAGIIGVDPAYGNRILRVTDGNTRVQALGTSFNTSASAEKNVTSYDESLFLFHDQKNAVCIEQFEKDTFQATLRGCFSNTGKGGGADFGYTQANNLAFFNYYKQKFYRFQIDPATWKLTPQLLFDPDAPNCLNGQIAANHWSIHDHALSSDDQTAIASIGPQQDADPYFVIWNAQTGCEWLNVKTWQVSNGWDTGLENPTAITWAGGIAATTPGGIHNAQIDRSGLFGILAVHQDGLGHKLFWSIGTNQVDATCKQCVSHWACDYGACLWKLGHKSGYDMGERIMGSSIITEDMNIASVLGDWSNDEHVSHANAEPGEKNIYLVAWQPGHGGSTVTGAWGDEITGVNWDGTQRTVRFNKHWNSGYGFWATARCSISRHGNYAICGSDYQMANLDKGFGNGSNEDTCDHLLKPSIIGTNGCRTDILIFELR